MAEVESPPSQEETRDALRKVQEYERWVRLLDAQLRVLERERQKLSAVVNHADAGFLVIESELRVVWANDVSARILGAGAHAGNLVGRDCAAVLCGNSRQCASCPAAIPFVSRAVAHHEMNLTVAGQTRHIYVTAMPILSPSGEVDQTMVMVQDVSDLAVLRRSQEALRASEGRLRLLIGQMPAILWSVDRELRFTSSIGAGLTNLGLEANAVAGGALQDYFGTQDPDFPPIAAHLRAIAGESVSFEMDWKDRVFQAHVEPFVDDGGQVIGAVGAALDITERKRAEEASRQSEARKGAILDTALDAIITMDHRGRITEFNPAAERLFGYRREEILGQELAERLIPPELRAAHRRGMERHLASGEGCVIGRRLELNALHRDGREFPVEISITRIAVDGPPCFTGYVRDLTERKQAEDALRQREEQLRHAQKMEAIGTLAGGVAHDFNNILTGILGYAQLLRREALAGSPSARAAEVIEKGATRAAALTQQLLGFARKGKNQDVSIDLHATIREVVGLLEHSLNKNITIHQDLAAEAAHVRGDPGQLQQVILNLAVNARDAMPAGGELSFITRHVEPGSAVLLTIADTGCGIPVEHRDRIFEPFFTTKQHGKGTGMGLAMVYGIVRNHGGTIRVDSEVGRGTNILVQLPRAGQPAGEPLERAEKLVRGTGRVLVVDDEEIVRSTAAELLEELGYDVVVATDGAEALEIYTKYGREIDAVLIDLVMPRMGGSECFRALKGLNPDVRAILSTGYGFSVTVQELLDEGMVGFVPKPYQFSQLSEMVARAVRRGH
ncbi:MAG TPA: PAS domain S-box protein [Candidatus Polarisedimenticolaceae bacterium]|nr:PAS domain S-box protein [Candidatus Polarisedimenticolaceae bacterium]